MWVFGYGSLMWDGWERQFGCRWRGEAILESFRRDFNKASVKRWGTPQNPGPTLGLEPDLSSAVVGIAFEFDNQHQEEILRALQEREGSSFQLLKLEVKLVSGQRVDAFTLVNRRNVPSYLGRLSLDERAIMAVSAEGEAGRCSDYVRGIAEQLAQMGVQDNAVAAFWTALKHRGKSSL